MALPSLWSPALERSSKTFAALTALIGALSLLGCGPAGKLTCKDDAACGDGKWCAFFNPDESNGVCIAHYQLAFRSPADQALLTAGSVPVTVELMLGSVTQPAPQTIDLFADGAFAGLLSLSSRTDLVATYIGSVPLADGQTVSLEAVVARGTLDKVWAGPVRVTGKGTTPPDPDPDPDPEPATVSGVELSCQNGRCVRDGVVTVTATVKNAAGVVRVSTDLLPGTYYTLSNGGSGATYTGTIPLSVAQFPVFSKSVAATVEALDGSGNPVSFGAAQVTVTRLRWAYPTGAAVTSPAVMDDGTLVVGLSKTTGQLLAVKPDASTAWGTTLEAQSGAGRSVTSAPVVGKKAIWVGSDDGRIYAVKLDGSGLVPKGMCPVASDTVTAAHLFTPLVYQLPAASGVVPEEAAYAGGGLAYIRGLAPSASAPCQSMALPSSDMSVPDTPIMSSDRAVFVPLSLTSEDREYVALLTVVDGSPAQLYYKNAFELAGAAIAMGVDGTGALLVADRANEVSRLVPSSSSTLSPGWSAAAGSVAYNRDGMVISSANAPLIAGKGGGLDHLTSAGKPVQGWPLLLPAGGANVTGLALATVDASGVAIYATTSAGDLFALDQNGTVVWSTRSGSTQLLGTGRLDFPTIAPSTSGQSLPTLYAGSADGHLYAVVVDSGLDLSSPWPKAHHDLRNTGNAMAVRP